MDKKPKKISYPKNGKEIIDRGHDKPKYIVKEKEEPKPQVEA